MKRSPMPPRCSVAVMSNRTRNSTVICWQTDDLAQRLRAAAETRGIFVNRLVNRAVEKYLDELLPTDLLDNSTPTRAAYFSALRASQTDECITDWPFGLIYSPNYGPRPRGYKPGGVSCPASHIVLELTGRPRPEPPGDEALHSCDVPMCLNPRHLRWGSQADNAADMVERGRVSRPAARLTPDQVVEIRRKLASGEQGTRLAMEFGVSMSLIHAIKHRKVWKDVPDGT